MTFKECNTMLMNLAKGFREEEAYVTLKYEYFSYGNPDRKPEARISCYSNASGNWTAQFQSYEDVIRDFSLQLAKKQPETTPE